MFCIKCGKQQPSEGELCPYCGERNVLYHKVKNDDTTYEPKSMPIVGTETTVEQDMKVDKTICVVGLLSACSILWLYCFIYVADIFVGYLGHAARAAYSTISLVMFTVLVVIILTGIALLIGKKPDVRPRGGTIALITAAGLIMGVLIIFFALDIGRLYNLPNEIMPYFLSGLKLYSFCVPLFALNLVFGCAILKSNVRAYVFITITQLALAIALAYFFTFGKYGPMWGMMGPPVALLVSEIIKTVFFVLIVRQRKDVASSKSTVLAVSSIGCMVAFIVWLALQFYLSKQFIIQYSSEHTNEFEIMKIAGIAMAVACVVFMALYSYFHAMKPQKSRAIGILTIVLMMVIFTVLLTAVTLVHSDALLLNGVATNSSVANGIVEAGSISVGIIEWPYIMRFILTVYIVPLIVLLTFVSIISLTQRRRVQTARQM